MPARSATHCPFDDFREPEMVERHYLTQAGPQVMNKLVVLCRHLAQVLKPKLYLPPVRQVPQSHLLKDILLMMTGVQSRSFPFDQVGHRLLSRLLMLRKPLRVHMHTLEMLKMWNFGTVI